MKASFNSMISLVLALGVSTGARAQEPARAKAAFFAMTVTSMDSTIAWYRDMLGLEVRRRGSPTADIEQAHLVAPWLEVELFTPKTARPQPTTQSRTGVNKIGFFVAQPTYTAILARLRQRNAKFIGREISEADGSRFFMVEDNNALAIQIFMVP